MTDTTYAPSVARTALQQIGKLRLAVLKPSMMTYDDKSAEGSHGDVDLQFLIGSANAKLIRKIRVTYRSGSDTYEVRSFVSAPLFMSAKGTSMWMNEKYTAEGIYADQLGEIVIAAARAAGARPRI